MPIFSFFLSLFVLAPTTGLIKGLFLFVFLMQGKRGKVGGLWGIID